MVQLVKDGRSVALGWLGSVLSGHSLFSFCWDRGMAAQRRVLCGKAVFGAVGSGSDHGWVGFRICGVGWAKTPSGMVWIMAGHVSMGSYIVW